MKRLLIAGAAVAALIGTPALAADMALKAAPPPPAPVWSWTGFYLGVNAGGSWSTSDVDTSVIPSPTYLGLCNIANAGCSSAVANAASPNLRSNAFVGGVQAGYNYQVNNTVLGIEADFNSFHNRMSATTTQLYPGFPFGFTTNSQVSTNWLLTVRPRVGVLATPAILLYATGGLAVTDLKYSGQFNDTQPGAFAAEAASVSQTKAGWTVGAGVEGKLSANWSVKAEYLYASFGRVSATGTTTTLVPGAGGDVFNQSANLHTNIARVGLNYLFH